MSDKLLDFILMSEHFKCEYFIFVIIIMKFPIFRESALAVFGEDTDFNLLTGDSQDSQENNDNVLESQKEGLDKASDDEKDFVDLSLDLKPTRKPVWVDKDDDSIK